MEKLETIWRVLIVVLVMWRTSRLLYEDKRQVASTELDGKNTEDFLGGRVMDCVYWISVWMSAQTAIWVACGFAGVFVNWLILSGIARLHRRPAENAGTTSPFPDFAMPLNTEASNEDFSCLSIEHGMQTNHG